MGNERGSRTVELDRARLAKLLAAESQEQDPATEDVPDRDLAADAPAPAPAAARTSTLHDPMTMALLAEVARDSRTHEMDPQTIADAIEAAGAAEPAGPATELPHPHLKRRG